MSVGAEQRLLGYVLGILPIMCNLQGHVIRFANMGIDQACKGALVSRLRLAHEYELILSGIR
jgi:hypothetical protein